MRGRTVTTGVLAIVGSVAALLLLLVVWWLAPDPRARLSGVLLVLSLPTLAWRWADEGPGPMLRSAIRHAALGVVGWGVVVALSLVLAATIWGATVVAAALVAREHVVATATLATMVVVVSILFPTAFWLLGTPVRATDPRWLRAVKWLARTMLYVGHAPTWALPGGDDGVSVDDGGSSADGSA
jgi:hypothetical protein